MRPKTTSSSNSQLKNAAAYHYDRAGVPLLSSARTLQSAGVVLELESRRFWALVRPVWLERAQLFEVVDPRDTAGFAGVFSNR